MFELIPSRWMRKFLEQEGFRLTDFQKATLIWNAPGKSRDEKLAALTELMAVSGDEVLCRQLRERIEYENEMLRRFKDNSAREHIYVVTDETGCGCGYFAEYDMAKAYLLQYSEKYEERCDLEKQRIISTDADLRVKQSGRWNPNLFPDIDKEHKTPYVGAAVAKCQFDDKGHITDVWSYEMTDEEDTLVDEWRRDRFESSFFTIPFVGWKGTPVKIVGTDDYGVLLTDTADWQKFSRRVENGLYVDYSDLSVEVYFLTPNGTWSHQHISPFVLEIGAPPVVEGDAKSEAYRCAFEAFIEYWSKWTDKQEPDPIYSSHAIEWAKEYRDACRMEEHSKSVKVDCAKTIHDIMI